MDQKTLEQKGIRIPNDINMFLPQQNRTIPNRLNSNKYVEDDGRGRRGMGY